MVRVIWFFLILGVGVVALRVMKKKGTSFQRSGQESPFFRRQCRPGSIFTVDGYWDFYNAGLDWIDQIGGVIVECHTSILQSAQLELDCSRWS